MNSAFPSRRRGSLVISVNILKIAKNGTRKTHVLSSVSLSYEQFMRYIGFLKGLGYIRKVDNLYQTTDKGLELIEEYDSSRLIRSVLAT